MKTFRVYFNRIVAEDYSVTFEQCSAEIAAEDAQAIFAADDLAEQLSTVKFEDWNHGAIYPGDELEVTGVDELEGDHEPDLVLCVTAT